MVIKDDDDRTPVTDNGTKHAIIVRIYDEFANSQALRIKLRDQRKLKNTLRSGTRKRLMQLKKHQAHVFDYPASSEELEPPVVKGVPVDEDDEDVEIIQTKDSEDATGKNRVDSLLFSENDSASEISSGPPSPMRSVPASRENIPMYTHKNCDNCTPFSHHLDRNVVRAKLLRLGDV